MWLEASESEEAFHARCMSRRFKTTSGLPEHQANLSIVVFGEPLALHNAIADRAVVLDYHPSSGEILITPPSRRSAEGAMVETPVLSQTERMKEGIV